MTRVELLDLLTERAKLAGVFSDTDHFRHALAAEADAHEKSGTPAQNFVDNNAKWRVHYDNLGLPHKHIPVAVVKSEQVSA